MPYSTKPDTKSETDTPVMKYTKDMYKKDVDLLTSFAQWSSSWRMAQFNSCSRVSKLLMCHNLLSGIYADFYTLEVGILVFARSLQLLIRDRARHYCQWEHYWIHENHSLLTFLCFHQLPFRLSIKFWTLYYYITDHYAYHVCHIAF